jgi:DNA-binding NtrC family response regulator
MKAARSILFVDDDRLVRQLFTRLLVKRGYRVSWAADRQQAAAQFSKQNFDVVIAELHLRSSPGGLDILRGFQKLQPTIGTILITSTDPEALETSVKAFGAVCISETSKD